MGDWVHRLCHVTQLGIDERQEDRKKGEEAVEKKI